MKQFPPYLKRHLQDVVDNFGVENLIESEDDALEVTANSYHMASISITDPFKVKISNEEVTVHGPSSYGPGDTVVPTEGYTYSFDLDCENTAIATAIVDEVNQILESERLTHISSNEHRSSFKLIPSPKLGDKERRKASVQAEAKAIKRIILDVIERHNTDIDAFNSSLFNSLKTEREESIRVRNEEKDMEV